MMPVPIRRVQDKGTNVAIARPEAPSAGYITADLENMTMVEGGTASGQIAYDIVDRNFVMENHSYMIAFEDTIIENDSRVLTPVTKNFSLIYTNGRYLDQQKHQSVARSGTADDGRISHCAVQCSGTDH